ncbi:MAG: aldo/keto reductase [Bacteroidota bacterium]
MQYRQLGSSDLNVSAISFGCMSLPSDQAVASRLIHHAHSLGINFYDTADLYQKGFNEQMLGQALKDRRQEVLIASKVGNQWRADGSGWDWNPRKAYILQAVEDSLRRLQTDYLDLYQLHGGTIDDPIDEVIEAFELLKERGLIRAYGISSIRPNVIREYVRHAHIDSIMMQYSLLDRRPEEACFGLLEAHQVSVLVRGALAKGLLAGKEARPYLSHSEEAVQSIQEKVRLLSSNDRSEGQTAIRFASAPKAVASIVAGVSKLPQIESNVGAFKSPPLQSEALSTLKAMLPQHLYEKHR